MIRNPTSDRLGWLLHAALLLVAIAAPLVCAAAATKTAPDGYAVTIGGAAMCINSLNPLSAVT